MPPSRRNHSPDRADVIARSGFVGHHWWSPLPRKANSGKQFILTFKTINGTDDATALRGLRALLKRALRSYGLRCVACEEILPAHPADAPAPSAFSAPFHDGD
jgi:hypothetical protein